jgi:hypothetical protein
MKVNLSRRNFICLGAASSLGLLTGCGMIIHPERRGQPPGGGLDWSVVALDGLGLLLFFLPGVIAFAVDFTTGAIYLPPTGYGDARPSANGQLANNEPHNNNVQLVEVHVPKNELSPERLEQIASKHTGREVRLTAGKYVTAPLTKLADFWSTREKLAAERS